MRSTKIPVVLCLCVGLCTACAFGADTRWMASASDLWSNPANWSNGVPTANDKAQFVAASLPACILDAEGAQVKNLAVGDGGGGTLKVVAGSLTVGDWAIVGYAQSNVGPEAGHFEVTGGVVNCQMRLFVGFMGEGHMTVDTGATVNVNSQILGLGEDGGSGFLNLYGGMLNLYGGPLNLSLYNGTANVDFWGGSLTLPDTVENRDYLARALGDGIFRAYNGAGEIVMDRETTPGRIIVRGLHALKPFPVDDSVASPGDVELQWVLPEPAQPGKTVLVDVYFGTDPEIGSANSPILVSRKAISSLVVKTDPKAQYYWAVDTYIGSDEDPVLGPVFTFRADNLPPRVDAGADKVTWLKDGIANVNLAGIVVDDGPTSVLWTIASEPSAETAVLGGETAADVIVTLYATGRYVVQLTADDGEYKGVDAVTIDVYTNSCEAAKSLPGYQPLPGDLNGDCIVNDLDLAILQSHWLECNALDCNDL